MNRLYLGYGYYGHSRFGLCVLRFRVSGGSGGSRLALWTRPGSDHVRFGLRSSPQAQACAGVPSEGLKLHLHYAKCLDN